MFQVRKKDVLNFSIPRACTYFFFSDTCMPLEKRYYLKCQAEMRRWKVIFSVSGFLLNSKCNLEKKKKGNKKKSPTMNLFSNCVLHLFSGILAAGLTLFIWPTFSIKTGCQHFHAFFSRLSCSLMAL